MYVYDICILILFMLETNTLGKVFLTLQEGLKSNTKPLKDCE